MSEQWLYWVVVAGTLLVLARLAREGLYPVYRFFFAFLAADLLRTLASMVVPGRRSVYAYFYVASTAAMLVLNFLVLRELYRHALAPYPGIARAGRYALYGGAAAAAAITLASAGLDFSNPAEKYPLLRAILAAQRGVLSILLLLLIGISAFLAWFPVRVRKNLVYYLIGYAVLFVGEGGLLVLRNRLGAGTTAAVNILRPILWSGCMLFWFMTLRRSGEDLMVDTGHGWNEAEAANLRKQLNAINEALMRR